MLLSFIRIPALVISVVTVAFLSGCTSATKAPVLKYYVLNSLDANTSLVEKKEGKLLSVEVASLRIPQYLERPQIVTRKSGSRLKVAEYHQWGGGLRKSLMRVLAANLSKLLATPNIAISPYVPPEPSDYLVELEILQFERDSQGRVILSVQWRLLKGEDRTAVGSQITNLSSPPVDADDYDATVSEMSRLYGELSSVIAKAMLKHYEEQS